LVERGADEVLPMTSGWRDDDPSSAPQRATRTPASASEAGRRGWIARGRLLLPGLLIGLGGLLVAVAVSGRLVALSPIVVAVALGIGLRNVGWIPDAAEPGLQLASTTLLRLGVVLLGFRLAVEDLLLLGVPTVVVVVVVVLATLGCTYWLGRLLSLPPKLALLTGTGFAICGATAIAAMREVIDADDDAPAFAIALVTIFGTLSIVVLPLIGEFLGLSAESFGQWAGAAVHDVGQVIATAATGGDDALAVAVVVKLLRVAMLGPLLVGFGLLWRRRGGEGRPADRPGLVPPFIVGFALAVGVRTTSLLPDRIVEMLRTAEGWSLTIALFAIGAGVRWRRLRFVGLRAFAMGLIAFLFVAGLAYLGAWLVHGADLFAPA
jgi:uncharacterized integral membrane protein (TIGR00698 family)